MFFLIRVAFWLCIVIMLLPVPANTSGAGASQVGAIEALSAAGAAVSDMGQFCTRKPEACVVGSQAAAALGQKAQASAKMVYDLVAEPRSEEPVKPASKPRSRVALAAPGTLTDADRAIAWRGPIMARTEGHQR